MPGRMFNRCRRPLAALALLGTLVYALILPGHLTSRFEAALFAADYGISLGDICQTSPSGQPSKPGAPASDCPICQGLAAFQLSVGAVEVAAVPAPGAAPAPYIAAYRSLAALPQPVPRSRGPPRLA